MATKCEKCGKYNKLLLTLSDNFEWHKGNTSYDTSTFGFMDIFYNKDNDSDIEICIECGWINGFDSGLLKNKLDSELNFKSLQEKLGFTNDKWDIYVDKFIDLTFNTKGISPEFEKIADKYNKRRPYILSMMLEFALTSGRPDIVDHLLNLGADPLLLDDEQQSNIYELINDNDIEKKVIRKMEKIMKKHGYDVNLHDTDREKLFDNPLKSKK